MFQASMLRKVVVQRLLATLLIASTLGLTAAAQNPGAGCKRSNRAEFGFWTWPKGVQVKVFVVAGDFTAAELPYLLKPLASWNDVSRNTNTHVVFEFQGEVPARRACENCLTVARGKVFDEKRRHATELQVFSALSNKVISHAAIVVDFSLTRPEALTNAIAHEIGHSFGLLDCYDCIGTTTIMSQLKALNVSNGMAGPSACDVAQIKDGYQNLKPSAASGPLANATVDEGEEPVDDDTPIVLPKP